jgi:hypothetical protein
MATAPSSESDLGPNPSILRSTKTARKVTLAPPAAREPSIIELTDDTDGEDISRTVKRSRRVSQAQSSQIIELSDDDDPETEQTGIPMALPMPVMSAPPRETPATLRGASVESGLSYMDYPPNVDLSPPSLPPTRELYKPRNLPATNKLPIQEETNDEWAAAWLAKQASKYTRKAAEPVRRKPVHTKRLNPSVENALAERFTTFWITGK